MDLGGIALIDQHAHNLLKPEVAERLPYPAAFTEAHNPTLWHHHTRHSLTYHRSLREIAILLDCEPTEAAILAQRQALGLEDLTRLCFSQSHLEGILLDDGFLPGDILPLEWHRQFLPVHCLLRLESLAEELFWQSANFEQFHQQFRQVLEQPPPGVVGFKTIAAYRTGLDIQFVMPEEAAASFNRLRLSGQNPLRLQDSILINFLLVQALEIAARQELPVQFHTGFGDPDLDLRLANPLHLRPLLEAPHLQTAPIVLLHAAYPYSREAGYLAAVYPQVYVDFGLAIPLLSRAGMHQTITMLLEFAPASKLLYSSDAHFIPELYYLAARWGRQSLGAVLEQSIEAGEITASIAEAMALAILRGNALRLYPSLAEKP